ncbi:selenocysteine-specific translation elongation factor [Puniceicoccaceae bacterium K14]|nr:selenocysteine-specific translation elongation factor [Puniceicoccaceae bacterium K14]
MSRCHYILGTAGHVDHGKSSLVHALTGVDPDRLPEEKTRGLTIDLGFASLDLLSPNKPETKLSVGVVDVPGHSDFVKNMVAGVGSLDLALLVVAADDGWMPQTEEHYQILNYLRVSKAIVVLTKVDLFDEIELVKEDVREHLAGGPWEDCPVITSSVQTGEGIEELRVAIARELDELCPVRDCGKPRIPVDRVFSLKGIGTVVTGTLIDGGITAGDALVVQPSGVEVRAREIQSYNQSQERAEPGTRVALNLAGLSRETRDNANLSRGSILCAGSLGKPSEVLDVEVEVFDRRTTDRLDENLALRSGKSVLFHLGSGNRSARIVLLEGRALYAGGRILAQLRFSEPVYAWVGDRFVLRDPSRGVTVGGGVVLDRPMRKGGFRKVEQVEFLKTRSQNPCDLDTLLTSLLQRDKALRKEGVLADSGFSKSAISSRLSVLGMQEVLVEKAGWVFEYAWWEDVSKKVVDLVRTFHADKPEKVGLPLSRLRTKVRAMLPHARVFDVLLEGLEVDFLAREGEIVRYKTHEAQLPGELRAAAERIRHALASHPRKPPSRGDLAVSAEENKALRFILDTGEAIQLDEKTVIARRDFEEIRDEVIAYLRETGQATASEMRQRVDTIRRVFLPLLERLDTEGYTYRDGDYRKLRSGQS